MKNILIQCLSHLMAMATFLMAIFTWRLAKHTKDANKHNAEINRLATCPYLVCNVIYDINGASKSILNISVYGKYLAHDIEVNAFALNETSNSTQKDEILEDKIIYNTIASGYKSETTLSWKKFPSEDVYLIVQYRDVLNNNYLNFYHSRIRNSVEGIMYFEELSPLVLKPMERVHFDKKNGIVNKNGKVIKNIPDTIRKMFAFENFKIIEDYDEENIIDRGKISKIG